MSEVSTWSHSPCAMLKGKNFQAARYVVYLTQSCTCQLTLSCLVTWHIYLIMLTLVVWIHKFMTILLDSCPCLYSSADQVQNLRSGPSQSVNSDCNPGSVQQTAQTWAWTWGSVQVQTEFTKFRTGLWPVLSSNLFELGERWGSWTIEGNARTLWWEFETQCSNLQNSQSTSSWGGGTNPLIL